MNEQIVKNGMELIRKFAESLGTTSEYLMGILTKQAYIEGIENITYLIILPVVSIFIWRLFVYLDSKIKHANWDRDLYTVMGGVGAIWFLICIGIIGNAVNSITNFYHPEYWALEKIVSLLK